SPASQAGLGKIASRYATHQANTKSKSPAGQTGLGNASKYATCNFYYTGEVNISSGRAEDPFDSFAYAHSLRAG
ncbi:MAG TPA: hypothetical protein VF447_12585, partial [Terriglobales bacterium]